MPPREGKVIHNPIATSGTPPHVPVMAMDPAVKRGHVSLFLPRKGRAVLVSTDVWIPGRRPPFGKDASPDTLALCEWPRKYKGFSTAHDDLEGLQRTVRSFEALLPRQATRCRVYPSTWKGNVPKGIHHRRVWDALTEDERTLLGPPEGPSYDHNEYDAVGLGLWFLGRLRR